MLVRAHTRDVSGEVDVVESVGAERRDLAGKVALVTGGSRGVGADTARIMAGRGARVAINYRDKARRAEQVLSQVVVAGSDGIVVQADITDPASVAAMIDATRDAFGTLDLLILNASGGLEKDVDDGYALRLNRDAQVSLVELALPLMPAGSRIVFVTSHLAHFHGVQPVMPEYEPVAASKKAGEVALRDLIPRLADAGVSLVVVSGDLIEGTITPKLLNRMRPGVIEQRRSETGWLPTAEDFATAIVDAAADTSLSSGDTIYVGQTD
jgi:3-oxoacyl-[acyl-carrier protein] reductase